MHSATHYVVLYSIVSAVRLAAFEENLRGHYNWWHFTPSAMIICTIQSPTELQQTLMGWIDPSSEKVLAIQLQQNGVRQGCIDEQAQKWLNDHLGPPRWFL